MNSKTPIYKNDDVDVISLLRVLWGKKWVIVVISALFGFASIYIALTATSVYRAEILVTKVSTSKISGAASLASQLGGLGNLVGANFAGGGADVEAKAFLRSWRLAEEFILRNELLSVLSGGGEKTLTLWLAVKQFREVVLSISENMTDGVTRVAINWTDPETAARWSNQYLALANELIRNRARQESERNIEYLNEQIVQTNVVGIERVMYNLLETETKTLMLANAREEYAFTIIDPAVAPEIRTSPRRKLIVMSGGVLGLFVGIVVVLFLNLYSQVMARDLSSQE